MTWLVFSVSIFLFLHIYSRNKDPFWFDFSLLNLRRELAHFLGFGFILIGVIAFAAGANWNTTLMAALYVGLGCLISLLEKPLKGKFDI